MATTTVNFNSDKYDVSNTPQGCNGRNFPFNNVAGETSGTNYRFRIVSDPVSNVAKIVFNGIRSSSRHLTTVDGGIPAENPYGDFVQAYDPNIDKPSTEGPIGFVNGYDTNEKYTIKQIDNRDGSIIASGKSLRWIPKDNESVLYTEMIGNDNFDSTNGGIFFQSYDAPLGDSGSLVSWGSSIDAIDQLENVVFLTLIEKENTTSDAPCGINAPYTGYGLIPNTGQELTQVRLIKVSKTATELNSTDPCDEYEYDNISNATELGVGYVFAKADNVGIITLFVHLQTITGSLNYNASFGTDEFFIETVELNNSGVPCYRYTLANLERLDVDDNATTYKRIKFRENGDDGVQYATGTNTGGTNYKVFQWNVGDLIDINNTNATKNEANMFSWLPSLSMLFVQECDFTKPFQISYGAIEQYNSGARFGNKGLTTSRSELTATLDNVRFVNLVKHITADQLLNARDESLVYQPEKQYLATWDTGGELLSQTLSKSNNYESSSNYIPGQKVIQIHSLNTEGIIEDYKYAFGTVISWEYPDPSNPTDTSAMKLLVKMDKRGPRTPDSLLGVEDYGDLQQFKVGSLINDTDNPLESYPYSGKIIPYTESVLTDSSLFSNWPYDLESPGRVFFTSNKNGVLVNDEEVFSELSETPVPSFIGDTRIRAISLNPTVDPTETYPLYKIYLFDSNLIGPNSLFGNISHISYRYPLTNNSTVSKNIIEIAKVTGKETYLEAFNGNTIQAKRTVIFEPEKDNMFIRIPSSVANSPFESVIGSSSLTFEIQKIYSVNFENTQDTITINVDQGSSSVSDDSVFLLQDPGVNWYVINRKTGQTFELYPDLTTITDPNDMGYRTSNSLLYNNNELTLTRQIDANNNEILIIAKISVTLDANNIKEKQLESQNEFLINPLVKATEGKYKNRYYVNLMSGADQEAQKKGILRKLDSVYITDSSGIIISGTKNIKDLFDIDFGVTDQKILNPKLILKSGYTTANGKLKSEYFGTSDNQEIEPSSINLEITYSLYQISQDSPGIFCRESFKSGSNNLELFDIPFYNSPNTGQKYHYSSLVDFRPTGLFDTSGDTLGNSKFVPHPDWSDALDVTYYLPRKDRVILTKNGKFEIVYGKPGIETSFPVEPTEAMSLHLLSKPPYVFDNKNIKIVELDNKRYTMKDIGKIDKRVKKLEYYTALSLLESSAESLLITDENGNNRFKSGILVDTFTGHGIGDVLHPDYNIAVDQKQNYARPPFIVHNSKVEFDSTEQVGLNKFVESVKTGTNGIGTKIYTFPFTTVPFAVQPLASRSISVQPHEVTDWSGNATLVPSSDLWVDETRNPDVIVNIAGNNDAWQALANAITETGSGPFGAHWGSWQTIGSTTNISNSTESSFINNGSQILDITSEITTTNTEQQRDQFFTELVATENQNALGDRITDVSIIPFIREQNIQIIGSGLKPNSRMYVFFDGIDVSEHCLNFATEQNMVSNVNGFSFASASPENLTTDSQGRIYIRFNIPGSTFRTGERVFYISDYSTTDSSKASSYASATFYSNGLGITREQTILTTRDFEINTNTVGSESRTITNTSSEIINTSVENVNQNTNCPPGTVLRTSWQPSSSPPFWSPTYWCGPNPDPLAQTFFVNEAINPDGIYVKSIDLFFARKPTDNDNLNVSIELRPVINGYPSSSEVYPGSKVTKPASEVNVSFDPNATNEATKTTFEFDYPIYLAPGEHSIVIKGQSADFEVYIAELGENIINTDVQISNQPYSGVFFTSANASTWSPEQNIDLMMVIKKCKFNTNQEYKLPVKNVLSNTENFFETLFVQSNFIDFNSCRVSWDAKLYPSESNQEVIEILPNVDTYLNKQYLYGNSSGTNIPLKLIVKASTTNQDISPLIDLERLGFIAINNRIESNQTENNGELQPYANYVSGVPRARYISRIVTLEEGFESNNCKVVLTLHKPKNTNIQVFAKLQSAYSTNEFHDRNYIRLTPSNLTAFSSLESNTENDWREITFDLPQETEEPFNKFCIKICFYSTDPAYIPRIKNMRAITVI